MKTKLIIAKDFPILIFSSSENSGGGIAKIIESRKNLSFYETIEAF